MQTCLLLGIPPTLICFFCLLERIFFPTTKKMVELLCEVELEGDGIGFWDPGEEKQGEDGFYVAGAYAIEGMSLPEP